MAVRVPCPACRAAVMIYNARYLVVVNCHECGHEFIAEGEDGPAEAEIAEPLEADAPWSHPTEPETIVADRPRAEAEDAVFAFCPMCGELAPAAKQTCPACGEPLPIDPAEERNFPWLSADRFCRRARLLGVLWILLAFALAGQDFWIGGHEVTMPEMLMVGKLTLPPFPLLTSVLAVLAVFALAGQFWAVAVGGLWNYLILLVVVWKTHPMSVSLLAVSIILTHAVLHHPPLTRGHS